MISTIIIPTKWTSRGIFYFDAGAIAPSLKKSIYTMDGCRSSFARKLIEWCKYEYSQEKIRKFFSI